MLVLELLDDEDCDDDAKDDDDDDDDWGHQSEGHCDERKPTSRIEVPKIEKKKRPLDLLPERHAGRPLGATRQVPSTSHKERPLCAALAPRSVALLSPHLNNVEECVRGVMSHDSYSKRSIDTHSCSVAWPVSSAQEESSLAIDN